jgi:general secretion pathway protein C
MGQSLASLRPYQRLGSLVELNLFGEENKAPVNEPVKVADNLPQTKLKLTLIGVITSTEEGKDSALIKDGNRTKRYFINDKIQGNVSLYQVNRDSVVIKRGENLEELKYPKVVSSGKVSRQASAQRQQNRRNNQQQPQQNQDKKRILNNRKQNTANQPN